MPGPPETVLEYIAKRKVAHRMSMEIRERTRVEKIKICWGMRGHLFKWRIWIPLTARLYLWLWRLGLRQHPY